jgi:hypothetical protein
MVTQEQVIQELMQLIQKHQISFKNNSLVLGDGTTLPFPTTSPNVTTRSTVITYR